MSPLTQGLNYRSACDVVSLYDIVTFDTGIPNLWLFVTPLPWVT